MEANYVQKGEEGRACEDCKHFEEDTSMQQMGKCFGKDVLSQGSCDYFEPKE